MDNSADLAVALRLADDLVAEIGNTHKYHDYRKLLVTFFTKVGGKLDAVKDMLGVAREYREFVKFIAMLDITINTLEHALYAKKEAANFKIFELGNSVMPKEELKGLSLQTGVVDLAGVFHDFHEAHHGTNAGRVSHDDVAAILQEENKIEDYFLRVATNEKEGTSFSPEHLGYSSQGMLKDFTMTDNIAVALYNGVQSKRPETMFEENLADFGFDFGYNSRKLRHTQPIFDNNMFNRNMDVLQGAVGRNRFEKKFFREILTAQK